MSYDGGTRDESDENLKEQLLEKLPATGSIGNKSLYDQLNWQADVYFRIRNLLRDEGKLVIGRGRGGSVRRAFSEAATVEAEAGTPVAIPLEDIISAERALYAPMAEVIRDRWVKDQSFESTIVELTHSGGRRADGTWARPDITCVAMTTYQYLPSKYLDIITFEVKPYHGVSLTAVYEALSHRRAATRSFVLFHVPEDKQSDMEDVLVEICEEASKHGIGIIVAAKPNDYDSWEDRVEAVRREPDPEKLNQFIQNQISEATKSKIAKWIR